MDTKQPENSFKSTYEQVDNVAQSQVWQSMNNSTRIVKQKKIGK